MCFSVFCIFFNWKLDILMCGCVNSCYESRPCLVFGFLSLAHIFFCYCCGYFCSKNLSETFSPFLSSFYENTTSLSHVWKCLILPQMQLLLNVLFCVIYISKQEKRRERSIKMMFLGYSFSQSNKDRQPGWGDCCGLWNWDFTIRNKKLSEQDSSVLIACPPLSYWEVVSAVHKKLCVKDSGGEWVQAPYFTDEAIWS